MSVVGEVIERNGKGNNLGNNSAKPLHRNVNGFPLAQHRLKSKSEFARAKAKLRQSETIEKTPVPPRVQPTTESVPGSTSSPGYELGNDVHDSWREAISRRNEELVADMSPEERDREVKEVREQLGAGIEDLMRRVREVRRRKEGKDQSNDPGIVLDCDRWFSFNDSTQTHLHWSELPHMYSLLKPIVPVMLLFILLCFKLIDLQTQELIRRFLKAF
jgi:hypothetical protein